MERSKEERLRASRRTLQQQQQQDAPEVEKYMTQEQKALVLREKRRETRPNYLRYFTLRTRVGLAAAASLPPGRGAGRMHFAEVPARVLP